jgi:hypothetical protein
MVSKANQFPALSSNRVPLHIVKIHDLRHYEAQIATWLNQAAAICIKIQSRPPDREERPASAPDSDYPELSAVPSALAAFRRGLLGQAPAACTRVSPQGHGLCPLTYGHAAPSAQAPVLCHVKHHRERGPRGPRELPAERLLAFPESRND